MANIMDKLIINRRYLIVEEQDIITLLNVMNGLRAFYVEPKMAIGKCGWDDHPTAWYMHFNASDYQWAMMVTQLEFQAFELVIKSRPKDAIFVVKRKRG